MNHINQVVEVTGTIMDCNLVEDGKSYVYLMPDDPSVLWELENRTEDLRNQAENDALLNPSDNQWADDFTEHSENYTVYPDKVVRETEVMFESINVPALKGMFRDIASNDEALYKRARVLGSLNRMKGGNICVFFHLVDEVPEKLTQFDREIEDAAEPLNDDWDF